jgi:hypothetical protein
MTERTLRRDSPEDSRRKLRQLRLRRDAQPQLSALAIDNQPSLEPGNKKTGRSSNRFRSVRVWNLPPLASCPGASDWCRSVCYNGDLRPTVFNRPLWQTNYAWASERPAQLGALLVSQIAKAPSPTAVRIHSSGDFFSAEYIRMWTSVIGASPTATFWAYTRSWTFDELMGPFDDLRSLPNVQLFASWDATMSDPPKGWRVSFVVDGGETEPAQAGQLIDCPEEFDGRLNCAVCGHCLRSNSRGVKFNAH